LIKNRLHLFDLS